MTAIAEHIPFEPRYDPGVPPERAARHFRDIMRQRRTVREFSERPVSRETIEYIVQAAGSAPSGANKQPWRFVCVSNPEKKREIRIAVETHERQFYDTRASDRWLADLAPLGTDAHKSFLERAPWLIVVFKLTADDDGSQVYYPSESVGIAVGMLLTAAHHAGLATLTHTPAPMRFLGRLLERPEHERPYMLIPMGYAAENAQVPRAAVARKDLQSIMIVEE